MNKIACAVIGVGYLGRFHAQKYRALPDAKLIAVCDINPDACDAVAQELGVPACYDYRELFNKVQAVSIAATTQQHFQIAADCIDHGIHVLIEKPFTETVQQADLLIQSNQSKQVKIQVGHLERFNSARMALDPYLDRPLFIEAQRLAPFTPRGSDVNVILDVMIHDIDLVQTMVNSPVVSIDAHGAPVLTRDIDIANARIRYANGSVANVTASRVSFKTVRKARIFQENSYISVDYQNKQFAVFHKGTEEMFPGIPNIAREEHIFEKGDALLEEIKAFLACIKNNTAPLVTAKDGRDALATAAQITRLIHDNIANQQPATI